MTLERRTPLKSKRATPRKVPTFTCSIRGCNNPPRFYGWCAKHSRHEADALFARYIKLRDRFCVNCGDASWPQAAHLISRRYYATRWLPENAVQLDRDCHKRYTEDPLAWDDWCIERLGSERWDALKLKARRGGMPDLGLVIGELRTLISEVAA